MSRRNALANKAARRAERTAHKEQAAFIQEAANETPVVKDQEVRFKNRKERRAK